MKRHSPQGRQKSTITETLCGRALDYAARGWWVFPLAPGSKEPFKESHGFKDATTDPDIINGWWAETPDANVGIATGQRSGFFVLDADTHKDSDCLRKLEKQRGNLPQTYTIQTAHGGRHYYFRLASTQTIRNSQGKLGRFLDVRGDGGYVVAPPSVVDGSPYKQVIASQPATAPAWLVGLLISPTGQRDIATEKQKPSMVLCPSPSLCISVRSVEDAVRLSLPDSEHQNDRCLLTLARALISGFDMAQKVVAFDHWYEQTRARGLLRQGQTRDHYLAKFLHAVKSAKFPLGQGPLDKAWALACSEPFPPEAALFETIEAKRIVALCFQLHRLSKGMPWPLACRVLARLTGIAHTTAATWLSALVSARILTVAEINTERLATRYTYNQHAGR